ncbi:MAG: ACT domain-containing protein [Christensenellales bacterium]|jgi:ACT domain-containing protein
MTKTIVTVLGYDQRGIIAKVSTLLYECGANILDINQTIMQEYFSMVMLVDVSPCTVSFHDLKESLAKLGEELELSILCQHEDIFNSMHRI